MYSSYHVPLAQRFVSFCLLRIPFTFTFLFLRAYSSKVVLIDISKYNEKVLFEIGKMECGEKVNHKFK